MKNTNNMEGLEVHSAIMNAFKNFKQGKLLESNYLQVNHTVSNDLLDRTEFDAIELSKREMIQKISHQLVEKYKDSFEERPTPFGIEFSLSMLVMSTQELKHIVDYCIRTMSESAIQEIRK